MSKGRTFTLGLLLAGAVVASAGGAMSAQAYKPAKNSYGQPDIGGAWSNSTLTRLERPATYGDRLAMTPAEVAAAENSRASDVEKGNRPTDPNATAQEVNATCDLKGFAPGAGCAYNQGFTEPGDLVMRVHGEPRTSFITDPANGRVPAPKAGAQIVQSRVVVGPSEGEDGPPVRGATPARNLAGQYDNPENRPLPERCIMSFGRSTGPIMQGQLYNSNYRIVQGKDSVAIWVEMVHDVRIVRIGGKHRTDGVRPYYGDAIGHYEGDSLVVETTNWPQAQALNGSWQNLKLTEKFTRVSATRMLYQFRVEDPTIWDQAWGGEYEFNATSGVYEYACHEGNYALEGVLAGARAAERAAAGATATR